MVRTPLLLITLLCHGVAWTSSVLSNTAVAGTSLSIQIDNNTLHGPAVIQPQHKGPPDHAPAHGYRAKHRYNYYPDADVYFDTGSRMYFFLSGDGWKAAASLPINLRTRLGSHVMIDMDSEKPYSEHEQHRKQHPSQHGARKSEHHKPENKREKSSHGKDK